VLIAPSGSAAQPDGAKPRNKNAPSVAQDIVLIIRPQGNELMSVLL
jgi:hypothetical protein